MDLEVGPGHPVNPVWFGLVWFVWFGLVWFGLILNMVWFNIE